MADSIEAAIDEDGLEEETDMEVDKVLSEIAGEYVAALPGTQAAKQVRCGQKQTCLAILAL